MPEHAALLEIDGSHEECLYSQMLFLKRGGYHVTLICNEKLRERVQWYAGIADEVRFFHLDGISPWQELQALWRLRRYLIAQGVTQVILNTAHGSRIRNFLQFPFPSSMRFHGMMHGINKLSGSMAQKLIGRKLRTYFLLNDYLVDNLPARAPKRKRFTSAYAIYFPETDAVVTKPEGERWIAIPGTIEFKRRDYLTLINALAKLPEKPRLRFLLLGNGSHAHGNGREVRELLRQHGLEDMFFMPDEFMPAPLLHAYVRQSDAVMPLIHPGTPEMDKYVSDQISGSFNLAFAYRKPLLMHRVYDRYADFRENALFYDEDSLEGFLAALPELLAAPDPGRYLDPKWSPELQADRYCAALK